MTTTVKTYKLDATKSVEKELGMVISVDAPSQSEYTSSGTPGSAGCSLLSFRASSTPFRWAALCETFILFFSHLRLSVDRYSLSATWYSAGKVNLRHTKWCDRRRLTGVFRLLLWEQCNAAIGSAYILLCQK
ncbi:hypothetical protein R1flu_012889 [Riccia fluitans]|uniref:Uncharacterized protein n=1 Tax=Riccia fluitans TaxID=41844 RepID=A0ABD1ZFZ4_9MARC